MKHLKTMNELFGLFSKPNPDIEIGEEILYKLKNEEFDVNREIKSDYANYYIFFQDNSIAVVRFKDQPSIHFKKDGKTQRLNLSSFLANQIYDCAWKKFHKTKKS